MNKSGDERRMMKQKRIDWSFEERQARRRKIKSEYIKEARQFYNNAEDWPIIELIAEHFQMADTGDTGLLNYGNK